MTAKSHYSGSSKSRFPYHLFRQKYEYDALNCHELVYNEVHVIGQPVFELDLRYWQHIADIFKRLREENINLEEVDLRFHPEVNQQSIAQLATSHSRCLKKMFVSFCPNMNSATVERVARLKNLVSLSIDGFLELNDSNLTAVLKGLPNLLRLSVCQCPLLSDASLSIVAQHGYQLQMLHASGNKNFTHVGVNELILSCLSMSDVDFSDCTALTFFGIIIKAQDMLQYASWCLQKVKLDNIKELRHEALQWLAAANADFQHLSLRNIRAVSDAIISGIACTAPHLAYLSVERCREVSNDSIFALAQHCHTNLKTLNLSRISKDVASAAMKSLLQRCLGLTDLDISGLPALSDKIFEISESVSHSPKKPAPPLLKRLNVSNCTGLSAYGVALLGQRFPRLTDLDISGITHTNDSSLEVIAQCCPLLRRFAANDVLDITDQGLITLVRSCRSLQEVHLSSSTRYIDAWQHRHRQFTDESLAILLLLPHLQILSLRNQCDIHFTSPALQAEFVVKGCGHFCLQSLDLRGSDEINPKGFAAVVKKCHNLNDVQLSNGSILPWVNSKSFWKESFFHSKYSLPRNVSIGGGNVGGGESIKALSRADSLGSIPSLDSVSIISESSSSRLLEQQSQQQQKSVDLTHPEKKSLADLSVQILRPAPNAAALRWRDAYTRRKVLEYYSAALIQQKFRLHVFWFRIKRNVLARKIAKWSMEKLEEQKTRARMLRFLQSRAARIIRKAFRKSALRARARAAVKIQTTWRRFSLFTMYRVHRKQIAAATKIQARVRGMLMRLAPEFILSQLYLSLPPFWRTILSTAPPVSKKVIRHQIDEYEMSSLLMSTGHLVDHIKENIVGEGHMAAKLPFLVPQPFDKKPYVSLTDGRKLAYFSHTNGLLNTDGLRGEAAAAARRRLYELTTESTAKRKKAHKMKQQQQHQLALQGGGGEMVVKTPRTPSKTGRSTARTPRTARTGRSSGWGDGEEDEEGGFKIGAAAKAALDQPPPIPLHMFNIVFWPLTEPLEAEDTSTDQHDPMVNSFDVIQNKTVKLHCELCISRLRVIHCSTCIRGYCFNCAFRLHREPARRQHKMEVMEPRIVHVKQVDKSLVYHIDVAKKTTYELGYLIKYLRSAAEAKRLQDEKRLAKEYEMQEEQRRLAQLKAQQEEAHRHEAATKISLLYRCRKARAVVALTRNQKSMERIISEGKKFDTIWIPLQKLIRRFLTRSWLAKFGVQFRSTFTGRVRRRKKSVVPSGSKALSIGPVSGPEMASRITWEIQQRRVVTRSVAMKNLFEKYCLTLQLLESNIKAWTKTLHSLDEREERFKTLTKTLLADHEAEMVRLSAIKSEMEQKEFEKLEKNLRRLNVRVEAAKRRQENVSSLRWWILQILRGNYRRKAVVRGRYQDSLKILEWISDESVIMQRIEFEMGKRLEKLASLRDTAKGAEWLSRYIKIVNVHQATLDMKQESVLQEEFNRLVIDEHTTQEFDSLLEELNRSLLAHSQYIAERCYLDQAVLVGPGSVAGSEEAVHVNQCLLALKRKQMTLEDNVLDGIKIGLQNKLNNEDTRNLELYGFTDEPDWTIEKFPEIESILLDKFEPPPHFELFEFFKVFMAQPWLGELAIEDVRIEEQITTCELGLGKAQEEYNAIDATNRNTEAKIAAANARIHELKLEIELSEIPPEDEMEGDREHREQLLEVFSREVIKNEKEVILLQAVIDKTVEFTESLKARMAGFSTNIATLTEKLQDRMLERKRLSVVFFDREAANAEDLFLQIAARLTALEKEIIAANHRLKYCETALAQEDTMTRILRGETTVMERQAYDIPLRTNQFAVQDCLHHHHERTAGTALERLRLWLENRVTVLQKNLQHLENQKVLIEEEEAIVAEYKTRRKQYENVIQLFQDNVLRLRRQRALQKELEERSARLTALRTTRLQHQKQEKDKTEAEDKAKEDAIKNKPKRENVSTQVAAVAKQTIRGAKDFVSRMKHDNATAMDPEEQRIAAIIRKKTKESAGTVIEGIRRLYLTCGAEESLSFEKQNEYFMEHGMPYFQRMERSFGNQLYLWMQNTERIQDFITNIEISHKDPGHEKHKGDLSLQGYEPITHDKAQIIFWVKRDIKRAHAFSAITLSFDEQEDVRCFVEGYQKLLEDDDSLELYGYPASTFWVRKVNKLESETRVNTTALAAEYENVKQLVKKSPNDPSLLALEEKVRQRLRLAKDRESNTLVVNPIQPSVELLALSPAELTKWMHVFKRFDRAKAGAISLSDIFETLHETPTNYGRDVFQNVEAVDPESGLIEFGDFLRACGIFCFFGKDDILRSLYNFADTEKKGEISHDQFVHLLNVLNPYDKARAKRALVGIELKPGRGMKYTEFCRLNEEFPALLHPAFRLQFALRDKTMGEDWWVDKLQKYQQVRKKIKLIDDNVDVLAETEMQRYLADEAKVQRMKERAAEIKSESSATRKVLLQAKQFLDEFS